MTGWQPAIETWSSHVSRSRSEHTAKSYINHVRALAADVAGLEPWQVTSGTLEDYLRRQNWSRSTRAKVLVSLRAFYAWAMDEGLCSRSPLAGVTVEHRRPGPASYSPRERAWRQPIIEHLTYMRAGGRLPSSVGQRRWLLGSLSELYADPWQVTSDDLALWISQEDLAPETRRSRRVAVSRFYGWAVQTGRTDVDPTKTLPTVLVPRALPRPITPEALREAIGAADDRQRLILMLAAMAGLRRAEIARVHFADIMANQLMVKGKGGHQRLVPLHPDLLRELRLEQQRRRDGRCGSGWGGPYATPTGWVFPSTLQPEPLTPRWIADIAGLCLPRGWTLHTLRHRFATKAYAAERDLRAVQELLGHMKPETTARYAFTPDESRIAAVLGAGL